jgi:hypothetical protein
MNTPATIHETTNTIPTWERMPAPGRSLSNVPGMRRGVLYALAKEGKIRTAAISVNGKAGRGARFVNIPSVLRLLESCSTPETKL